MIVTARAIAEYREMLRRISDKAANEVQQYMLDHHFEIDDAFLEYADAIVVKYGEAAGSLSAQFYDNLVEYWQIQNASPTFVNVTQKPLQIAEIADLPTENEVAKTVYGTMKESPNKIPSAVGRLVKRTAEDTTLKNAIRDGAQFAWIPSGDSCPFCIMLASRGWQYASKKALKNGHAEHIHPNCDCTYVVRFDESSNVAGYDPDKYKKMYDESGGDINAIRKRIYDANKDEINAQRRDADQARNLFSESVNILIPKSVGATGKNYNVRLPGTKEHAKLKEGQNITGHPFMGKDTDTVLNDRFWLEANYHIPADEWQKVSGDGIVIVHGEERFAELHWYQADGEVYDMKVKRWLDEG